VVARDLLHRLLVLDHVLGACTTTSPEES